MENLQVQQQQRHYMYINFVHLHVQTHKMYHASKPLLINLHEMAQYQRT